MKLYRAKKEKSGKGDNMNIQLSDLGWEKKYLSSRVVIIQGIKIENLKLD